MPAEDTGSRTAGADRFPHGNGGLLAFLNSALGLWLLSTVFISGGSYLFATWRDGRSAKAAEESRIARLDLEIGDRLENAFRVVPGGGNDVWGSEQNKAQVAALPGKVFLPPPTGYDLYPEFRGRSLRSLVGELYSIVPDKEKLCVQRARESVGTAWERWSLLPLTLQTESAFRDEIDRISSLRWSIGAQAARDSGDFSCSSHRKQG